MKPFHFSIRLSALVLFLALLPGSIACSSVPQELQPPPELPSRLALSQAPKAPAVPVAPMRPEVNRPNAPKGRRETLDEVYRESFEIDSVPISFPISKQDDVVLSVPLGTSPEVRVSLMGAFLAAGFLVKDAGELGRASFQLGALGTEQQSSAAPRSTSALVGMDILLRDPTSLWAPDLLSNTGLAAAYFLRIFRLDFEDIEDNVVLNQVFDKTAVVEFRTQVSDLNAKLKQYNSDLVHYEVDVDRYQREYNSYVKLYEKWERDEARQYDRRFAEYGRSWNLWRAENDEAIRTQLDGAQECQAWQAPAASQGLKASGLEIEHAFSMPISIGLEETAKLEASLADQREVLVPARQLLLLAELVDARTGRVVWVANARCHARQTWSDSRLLMETIGRMSTSKR